MKVRPIVNESTIDCPICGAFPGNAHRERDCFDMIQWAAAAPELSETERKAGLLDVLDSLGRWPKAIRWRVVLDDGRAIEADTASNLAEAIRREENRET